MWRDVLLWLEKDPDTNAKDLLARLRQAHPGRSGDAQLRTVQRRVKNWRSVMARKLVYTAPLERASEPSEKVELVLVEVVNRVVDVKQSSIPEEEQPCPENSQMSRASTKHTSGAEQKCTTREVIGQRKCPRQLFGRGVTEAGWQQAGRVSE